MHDLRAIDLPAQALGAIEAHAQNGRAPTALELELIAEFQRTSPRFFSDGRLAFFANMFKTPTLWGVRDTAPYFHDNSAKDLDDMLKQYDWFFLNDPAMRGQVELTVQDKEDIKAFLKLL